MRKQINLIGAEWGIGMRWKLGISNTKIIR
jgi:hypothetical protein